MPDDIDEQSTAAEQAFRHEPEFLAIHPFSFVRETAAEALGMRYGSLTEEEVHRHPNPDYAMKIEAEAALRGIGTKKLNKAEKTQADQFRNTVAKFANEPPETITWDGMKRDAAIVLWLCSQPDSTCQRARRQPREFEGKIDAWADANGLRGSSENMKKAIAEFSRIMAARNEGRGVPDTAGGKEEPDPNA